jgi:hypothetical protein
VSRVRPVLVPEMTQDCGTGPDDYLAAFAHAYLPSPNQSPQNTVDSSTATFSRVTVELTH